MNWMEIASTSLLKGIQGLVDPGLPFTDCVICVEDKEFPCHRFILSAYSDYFHAMFTSGMQEDLNGRVELGDVPHQDFAQILDALYKGSDILDESNAVGIWLVTNMLQINCLQQHAQNYLIDHLSVENCISVWRAVQNSKAFSSSVLNFITKEFQAIKSNDTFLTLSAEELAQIITSGDLNVSNEDEVVGAVLLWIKHHEVSRTEHLQELLSVVRLRCVSATFIVDVLLSEKMVTSNDEIMAMVQKSMHYHTALDRRHDECPPNAFKRKCDTVDNILVVLGQTNEVCLAYQLRTGQWFQIPKPPCGHASEFGACTYGEDIYFSHKVSRSGCLYHFDVGKNKWFELSPLIIGRSRHAQVAVGQCLYVLGGQSCDEEYLDSVECYNIKKDVWSIVGKLNIAVRSAGVAVSGKKIIIFGGKGEEGVHISKVQCYDTATNTSCGLGEMPEPGIRSRVVVKAGKMYLILEKGQIFEVIIEENHNVRFNSLFAGSKLWSFTRNAFGAGVYDETLLCIGGKVPDGFELESEVDIDIPGLCKRVRNLRFANLKDDSCYSCFHTVIDKSYLDKPFLNS